MKILGIETSCDETAIALIETDDQNNLAVLSNEIHSQIDIHKEYGGVFPSLAKREHAKNLVPVLLKVLEQNNSGKVATRDSASGDKTAPASLADFEKIFEREPDLLKAFQKILEIEKPDIDLITVTEGPGLEPALWVGINFARALSKLWQIPMLPVNHMEGHIMSVITAHKEIQTPAIALLISGGHTEIVLMKNFGEYELIGQTKDDAIGEAFDKTARILDLPYPGGPEISRLAEEARIENLTLPENYSGPEIKLPRPMINSGDFDFSFSGLKTAVLYLVKKLHEQNLIDKQPDTLIKKLIAREFEDAATEVIVKKTERALVEHNIQNLIVGGGVIANKNIRKNLQALGVNLYMPEKSAITDNALMIAIAGFYKSKTHTPLIAPEITANGNLRLSN